MNERFLVVHQGELSLYSLEVSSDLLGVINSANLSSMRTVATMPWPSWWMPDDLSIETSFVYLNNFIKYALLLQT